VPSTVVHLAFGLLVAAAVLGPYVDRRALLVVAGAVVFVDLDTVTSLVLENTHRALFHTLLLPLFAATYLFAETRLSERSVTRERYGDRGVRVAWAAIAAVVVSAIGLDLFTSLGANVLYPLHDQFYSFTGSVNYSTGTGLRQSFVEFRTQTPEPGAPPDARPDVSVDVGSRGSTRDYRVASGVNPERGREPEDVRRVFPVVQRGWQLWLVVASVVGLTMRARLAPGTDGPGRSASTDGPVPRRHGGESRPAVRRVAGAAGDDRPDRQEGDG
jgi:membrane-bound metal-dependent hydrolase YbcI (DUF457 family)